MGLLKKAAANLTEELKAKTAADAFGVGAATVAASAAETAVGTAREALREAGRRLLDAAGAERADRGTGGAAWLAACDELAAATANQVQAREALARAEAAHLAAAERRERAKVAAEQGFRPLIHAAVSAAVREALPVFEAAVAGNEAIQRALAAGNAAIGFPLRSGIVGGVVFEGLTADRLEAFRSYAAQELSETF